MNGATPVFVERSVYENNPASPCVITKITRYDGSGNLKEVVSIECLDANGSSKSVVTDKAGKVIKIGLFVFSPICANKSLPQQTTK